MKNTGKGAAREHQHRRRVPDGTYRDSNDNPFFVIDGRVFIPWGGYRHDPNNYELANPNDVLEGDPAKQDPNYRNRAQGAINAYNLLVAQENSGAPPSYTPPPDGFSGFPDAERQRPKGGRPRWRLPNGDYIEWDGQHRELERYNRHGKPKGVWTPDGKLKPKDNSGREIDPMNVTDPWYVPSQETIKNTLVIGTIAVGVGIIIFDIVTIPSGEGLIGVQMIGAALAK